MPSAPPEPPPSYASHDLGLIIGAARHMTDHQLAERLSRPFDIRQPSRLVELVATKDEDGARAWYAALLQLRAQGRLKNELAKLLSGQGTAPRTTQPLQQALLTHASRDHIDAFIYANGHVLADKHWLNMEDVSALMLSPTSALRDAVRAGCTPASFAHYLSRLRVNLQLEKIDTTAFASFLQGGQGPGNVLDAALDHEDPDVLGAFLRLAITAPCDSVKNYQRSGRSLRRHFPVCDADLERILLPTARESAESSLRQAVQQDRGRHLEVYLNWLVDGCEHHGLPTKLLVKALSACLARHRTLEDLRDRQPNCHEVLVRVKERAVAAGLLAPWEASRFEYGIPILDPDDPRHAAAHEADAMSRPTVHVGTQTESKNRCVSGLLACFGAGASARREISRDGDAARAARPPAAVRR